MGMPIGGRGAARKPDVSVAAHGSVKIPVKT
jgi:hypothetical protein